MLPVHAKLSTWNRPTGKISLEREVGMEREISKYFVARTVIVAALLLAVVGACYGAPRGADGELRLSVIDRETQQPIPVRMHLKNARRRAVTIRHPEIAAFGDHLYLDGKANLALRAGQYTFELEGTPEYRTQSGHFTIDRHADDEKTIEMERFADLAREGWWGGDLDVTRQLVDLPLAMRAEGLAVAAVTMSQSVDGKSSDTRSGKGGRNRERDAIELQGAPTAHRDSRLGGELLIYNWDESFKPADEASSALSSLDVLQTAKKHGAIVVARTPLAWNLPVWLASGELDAIMLIDSHSLREGTADDSESDRPQDESIYSGSTGRARWGEAVYHHVLNCGLRIPPVAGSGSGSNKSPLGTNRVYVHLGDTFALDRWWDGLLAGRVFVTNGPLLRTMVEGQPPGYVFHVDGTERIQLEIGLNLATRTPVEYLQIVKNGEIASEVRLDEFAKSGGRLPALEFDDSGWFLVRAVTTESRRHQFAASGPYYVEKNGRPRVSRRSAQFFLDWIGDAEQRLHAMRGLDETARKKLLAEQQSARSYFESLLAEADAE